VLAAILIALGAAEGVTARWRCEPAAVEVGEPFALVLELEHPAELRASARDLAGGALALDESWVVLSADAPVRPPELDAGGAARTRRAWRVASLEPGERALGEMLSAFALPPEVTRIQLGDAVVRVAGVLGPDEDAPRPLRAFPSGFADVAAAEERGARWPWAVGVLALVALGGGAAVVWVRRRRARPAPAPAVSPLERLAALETSVAEHARESCFELTRLVRASADRARAQDRAGLTDEEWLAVLGAARVLPADALAELEAVLARAARVTYAGEPASPWALEETFACARSALISVGSVATVEAPPAGEAPR
jgi:hypothetical protein